MPIIDIVLLMFSLSSLSWCYWYGKYEHDKLLIHEGYGDFIKVLGWCAKTKTDDLPTFRAVIDTRD